MIEIYTKSAKPTTLPAPQGRVLDRIAPKIAKPKHVHTWDGDYLNKLAKTRKLEQLPAAPWEWKDNPTRKYRPSITIKGQQYSVARLLAHIFIRPLSAFEVVRTRSRLDMNPRFFTIQQYTPNVDNLGPDQIRALTPEHIQIAAKALAVEDEEPPAPEPPAARLDDALALLVELMEDEPGMSPADIIAAERDFLFPPEEYSDAEIAQLINMAS